MGETLPNLSPSFCCGLETASRGSKWLSGKELMFTISGLRAEGSPLEPVSLELAPGDIIGLAGPSGVGKSRLLRCMAGLDDPAAGTVTLAGRCPAEIGWPQYRRQVCYVQQQPTLFPGTVEENLRRVFEYDSAQETYDELRSSELLERLHLPRDILSREATRLSAGEGQRVALVRALLVEPRVLLLDEPTSALDDMRTQATEDLLRSFTTKGAVLLVSHDDAQLERLCQLVVRLKR